MKTKHKDVTPGDTLEPFLQIIFRPSKTKRYEHLFKQTPGRRTTAEISRLLAIERQRWRARTEILTFHYYMKCLCIPPLFLFCFPLLSFFTLCRMGTKPHPTVWSTLCLTVKCAESRLSPNRSPHWHATTNARSSGKAVGSFVGCTTLLSVNFIDAYLTPSVEAVHKIFIFSFFSCFGKCDGRKSKWRAVEIDSLLSLVPVDNAFREEPPQLGPAAADETPQTLAELCLWEHSLLSVSVARFVSLQWSRNLPAVMGRRGANGTNRVAYKSA